MSQDMKCPYCEHTFSVIQDDELRSQVAQLEGELAQARKKYGWLGNKMAAVRSERDLLRKQVSQLREDLAFANLHRFDAQDQLNVERYAPKNDAASNAQAPAALATTADKSAAR